MTENTNKQVQYECACARALVCMCVYTYISQSKHSYRESMLKGNTFLLKMPKNLHMSFAEMTRLAARSCLSVLLALKVQILLLAL